MAYSQEYKLADYFAVIGLDEDLTPLDSNGIPSQEELMIEKVEIIYMPDPSMKMLQYNSQAEKWIDLDGSNQIFLRIIYGNNRPITDINFYRIKYQKGQSDKMQIPASMGIEPVPIKIYGDPESEKKFKKTKKINPQGDKKKDMICFYGDFDLTPYLENVQSAQQGTNLCFCFSRKKMNLPIQDIEIIQGVPGLKGAPEEVEFNLPQNMKQVNYRLGKASKNRLLCFKNMQYLKKRFQAKVLDRYPPFQHDRTYYPFPGDILSQFCFPSGIQFETQRGVPTHFSFILTDAAGQHIYGTALIFDETLSTEMKNQLKLRGHVYNVNIDGIYSQKAICILSHYAFMDSFKEILKQLYRIHLSHTPIPLERFIVNIMEEIPVPDKAGQLRVLHEIGNQPVPFFRAIDQYPPYASKSDVEYLFRALNAEQVIDIFLALLLEKKILLISKYKALLTHASVAFMSFLYPLSWKHVLIPILPKNMTDVLDAPVPFLIGIDPMILKDDGSFEIPNEVYRVDLDNGFITLRDSKPKMPSKEYKALKTRLIKATEGIERPSHLLDQVEQAFNVVQFEENMVDDDGNDGVEDGRLKNFRFDEYEVRDAFLEFMTSLMSGYTKCLNAPDSSKDVFLDSRDFFDFKRFRTAKDATKNITLIYKLTETTLFANFIEARSFGKSDQDEQIMFFDEICKQKRTKNKPQLVGPFREQKTVKTMAPSEEGLEIGQNGEQKIFKYETFPKFDISQYYVPRPIDNYNNEEAAGMHLKSLINNEQLSKMHDSEWARYLAEIIYILWYQIFSTTLPMYQNHSKELVLFCKRLLHHVNRKLHPMRDIEIIYRRLFEACGTCRLQDEILDLFNDMKKNKIDPDKVTFGTYYQAFQVSKKPIAAPGSIGPFTDNSTYQVLGINKKESYLKYSPEDFQQKLQEFASQQQKEEEKVNLMKAPLINNRLSVGSIRGGGAQSESEFGGGDFLETQVESNRVSVVKLSQVLENSLYLEIVSSCQQCDKPLKEEEILSGFSKNLSAYVIRCPMCKESYVPKFMVYSEHKTDYLKGKEGMSVQLLSPVTLYKEYINIVEQKGEQVVLRDAFLKEHRTVFWNIILYFKIMKLPLFMLDLDYSQLRIKAHVSQIKKYLPLEKKSAGIISLAQIPKQPSSKVESSPARKSSISRLTASVLDTFLGSNNKNQANLPPPSLGGRADSFKDFNGSEKGFATTDKDSARNMESSANQNTEKKSLSNYFGTKRHPSSHKSGGGSGGAGSVVTSLSDLERIEKIMNLAQYANKSIVKYFSKHLEEFRREQSYAKEIIQSEVINQGIPEAMNKYIQNAAVGVNQNPLTKNFSEWSKNTQQVTADAIINSSEIPIQLGSKQSSFNQRMSVNSNTGSNADINQMQSINTPPLPPPKLGMPQKSTSFASQIFSALSFGGRSDSSQRNSEPVSQKSQQQLQTPNQSMTMINSKPPRDHQQDLANTPQKRVPLHQQISGSIQSILSPTKAQSNNQNSDTMAAQLNSNQQAKSFFSRGLSPTSKKN